jgi:hypothetical protein
LNDAALNDCSLEILRKIYSHLIQARALTFEDDLSLQLKSGKIVSPPNNGPIKKNFFFTKP